jgi:hypothetical protein
MLDLGLVLKDRFMVMVVERVRVWIRPRIGSMVWVMLSVRVRVPQG